MSNGAFTAAVFVASCGFYLLLAGTANRTELMAAVAVAGAAAAFAWARRRGRERAVALPIPPGRVLARTGLSLATDTARVGGVLLRALASRQAGSASWQRFHPGGRSPRDAGRRAIVTLGTSLAPNGFVLDVRPSALPEAGHGLLLHRLAPAPPCSDAGWPT